MAFLLQLVVHKIYPYFWLPLRHDLTHNRQGVIFIRQALALIRQGVTHRLPNYPTRNWHKTHCTEQIPYPKAY